MEVKTYLELEDITKLEEAADCLRDKLLIRLLYFLACRISEELALTDLPPIVVPPTELVSRAF